MYLMCAATLGLLALLAPGVAGYPEGADKKSCDDLIPGHGSAASDITYTVSRSAATYTKGGTITVTVAGSSYAGFMLSARPTGKSFGVGTWTTSVAHTKTMSCNSNSDTLTHSSISTKASGTSYTWRAPSDCNPGTIQFKLSVAATEDKYYKGMASSSVTASGYAATDVECSGSDVVTGSLVFAALLTMLTQLLSRE